MMLRNRCNWRSKRKKSWAAQLSFSMETKKWWRNASPFWGAPWRSRQSWNHAEKWKNPRNQRHRKRRKSMPSNSECSKSRPAMQFGNMLISTFQSIIWSTSGVSHCSTMHRFTPRVGLMTIVMVIRNKLVRRPLLWMHSRYSSCNPT